MKATLAVALVLIVLPAASRGDDPAKRPAAPDGWQYVLPKDRSYQFLVPKNWRSLGNTSRKFTARGIRAEVLMNYCTTRSDLFLDVEGATLIGRGVSRLKANEMIDIMLEGERQQGFTVVGDAKETTIGKLPAREYRLRKENNHCRNVLFAVKNRVFEMRACAADEAKLDSDEANTFFQSFAILKDTPDAETKEEAVDSEQRAKESMAKYGFKWTLRLEEMTPPDKPVIGLLHGREFKPDSIVLETGGTLHFRQGPAKSPDADVRIVMFTSPKDKFERRTIEVKPNRKTGNVPTILLRTNDAKTRVPKSDSFFDKYALKLSFGSRGADGLAPCTIYLCTPDKDKSFLAGRFMVAGR